MLELNGTIIAVILNFVILVWILERFLYKPVRDAIRDRKAMIENDIVSAKNKLAEAEALEEERRSKLSSLQKEAQEMIKNASETAEKMKSAAFAEAKAESEAMKQRSLAESEELKEQAICSARHELASLVCAAAGKLIGKKLDDKDNKSLIDGFVAEIEKAELN